MSGGVAKRALEACFEAGVREFVVCAGARNAALVLALSRVGGLRVWNHFEERSAAFFALGATITRGHPVAIVTTSGTAASELFPAVIEAHYQRRPLLVVTADRPVRFRGSGAPQAIEQVGLFGKYVEGCDDCVGGDESLMNGWGRQAPWHLNVCQEENEQVPELSLPQEDRADPASPLPGVVKLVELLQRRAFRGVAVLVGGLDVHERKETLHFLTKLGAPVVADATSGLREALGKLSLVDGDRILRTRPPGQVLRLGSVPVGRFWRDLEDLPEVDVLSVAPSGFSGLARPSDVIAGPVHRVLRSAGEVRVLGDAQDYLRDAARRRGLLEELLERYPDSEPSLVRVLSNYATTGESVFLGNSLPIREWNLCAQTSIPYGEVLANRGANGIDGQLSTWLGATADSDGAWGIFGDLTALYDLAAPALLGQVAGERRVLVVINNGGGRIFERLPRLRGLPDRERDLMANAHAIGFEHWASMWGMDYVRIENRESFEVDPGARPLVVEIRPDAAQTESFWQAWSEG